MRRLTILLVAVGALLLIPAAAQAEKGTEPVKVILKGTGSGKAFIDAGGNYRGIPEIKCTYNGTSQSGVCETIMSDEGEGWEQVYIVFEASPGSKLKSVTAKNVETEACALFPGSETKGVCTPYVEPPGTGSGEAEVIATFEKEPAKNLALNIEEGSGTVVSNPAGLSCSGTAPKTCEATVAEGSVTLTASPAPGYLFKSWKGCETVNGRQCTITATGSLKEVGAKFYKVFSLKGSKTGGLGIMGTSPGGIVCGYACTSSTALYKEGALTVKAKPAKHFEFVEFKGGTGSASSCNGVKALECTIATFNSNSTIEEVYAEEAKNTLSVSKEGGGQGFIKTTPANINCGYTCTAAAAQFYASESAAITVTLNKGTSKVTWTTGAGTCTGNALTCSVPMSSSKTLVAKFD